MSNKALNHLSADRKYFVYSLHAWILYLKIVEKIFTHNTA